MSASLEALPREGPASAVGTRTLFKRAMLAAILERERMPTTPADASHGDASDAVKHVGLSYYGVIHSA